MNRRILSNPYWYVILGPLLVFTGLAVSSFPPDWINIPSRLVLFGFLGYAGARYVGKAPRLVIEGDMSPEARNIIGWAMTIVSLMLTQGYTAIYVAYDRPAWLTSAYFIPAFVVLMTVGMALVVSSVPKFPPFGAGPRGLSTLASFTVGFISAAGLFFASHLPTVAKIIGGLYHGLLAAF